MIIYLDVDGVLADIISAVLARYNKLYACDLKNDDITDWNVESFLTEEANEDDFFSRTISDPTIYDETPTIIGAVKGVSDLRNYISDVVFVTNAAPGTEGRKRQWLFDHGILQDNDTYIETERKNLLDAAGILIDDNILNVTRHRGKRILFAQPWNETAWSRFPLLVGWGCNVKFPSDRTLERALKHL